MTLTEDQKQRLLMAESTTTHEQRLQLQTFCLDLSAQLSILSEKGSCEHVKGVASRFLGPLSTLLTDIHGEELLAKLAAPYVRERSMEVIALGARANGEKAS